MRNTKGRSGFRTPFFELIVKKAVKEGNQMEQYNVTGMSCAACSARVEKAVGKLPGVTSCSVSLLTNSMGVEGSASDAEIIQAVENAGYGAAVKTSASQNKNFFVRQKQKQNCNYFL